MVWPSLMSSLRSLSDPELLSRTHAKAAEERRVTSEFLQHLAEVERRKLYLAQGHSSLWDYLVRDLGYSEGSAHRRISALRLMLDVPEIGQALEDGRLSLSVASKAQTFLRREEREQGKS